MSNEKNLAIKLFNTLKEIKELASPQINLFIPEAVFSRPLYLTFRFIETIKNENDKLYLNLIKAISDFEGNVIWVMHNYKTSKNYVIEPIEFYLARRKISSSNSEDLKRYLGEETFNALILSAINDVASLCLSIKSINWSRS